MKFDKEFSFTGKIINIDKFNPIKNISSIENIKNNITENQLDEIFLPIGLFNNNSLSALEAVTKYLKEEGQFRFKDIAIILNRNQKTVWDAYRSSQNKMVFRFNLTTSKDYTIPSKVFRDRSLSILEVITEYLKEDLNLRYCQIAPLLCRDQRTVWTAYNRAKKKRQNKKSKDEEQ